MANIDYNKIYQSKYCGPFKIIKDLGKLKNNTRYVLIRFIETGTEKATQYSNVNRGYINDPLHGIDFNKIYTSMYSGPFQIISYIGKDKKSRRIVRIKFLNTGYEYNTRLEAVRNGTVKDNSLKYEERKIIANSEEQYMELIMLALQSRWRLMMKRCYDKNKDNYSDYGELGVTVCERWHNMNNFVLDCIHLPNFKKFYYNPELYQLDKDFLQQNIPKQQRIYSPETCIFLYYGDNINLAIKEANKNKYHGVRKLSDNKYQVKIRTIDGVKPIAIYSNLLASLNEYNYYYAVYGNYEAIPIFNENIKYMSHEEALKYRIL